jgi:hypothetical protein
MAENTNLNLTIDAWADIVIENWLDRLTKLNIGYQFNLERELTVSIRQTPGGLPSVVEFSFPYYGKMVDMGVGKGVKLEDVRSGAKDYGSGEGGHRRRPKKWHSKVFYSEVQKLTAILAEKYGKMGALSIVENIDDNALKWTPTTI